MIPLWWCRLAVVGLIALQPAWFLWIAPPDLMPALPLTWIAALPLLVLLPALWRLRARALVLAGCLLLIYFSFAVMEAFANPSALGPAIVQIALIAAYFTALPRLRRRSKDHVPGA